MAGNNDGEEEEATARRSHPYIQWGEGGGAGGFSPFSIEDLASRDLCVPVYMRTTKKIDDDKIYSYSGKEKKKDPVQTSTTSHGTL